jgi:hypothetical protein
MGAEKSQRQLSEKDHDIGKKAIEDSWERSRKDIVETKEKLEDKVSKEVEDYLTKEVLPYDKTTGGTEIEKHKRKMTRYLFKNYTAPLDESVKKSDESYIQFMKDRVATETYHKRVSNSAEKPLSKRELEKAYEISAEMEKENE